MKLDDLEKRSIYKVPDGYFEELPGKIQARIGRSKRHASWIFVYKFQLAAAVILFSIGLWWFLPQRLPADAESILASVETEDLIAYLDQSDLSTEDLLEHVEFDMIDAEEIEGAVYELDAQDEEELNLMLEKIDLDTI